MNNLAEMHFVFFPLLCPLLIFKLSFHSILQSINRKLCNYKAKSTTIQMRSKVIDNQKCKVFLWISSFYKNIMLLTFKLFYLLDVEILSEQNVRLYFSIPEKSMLLTKNDQEHSNIFYWIISEISVFQIAIKGGKWLTFLIFIAFRGSICVSMKLMVHYTEQS